MRGALVVAMLAAGCGREGFVPGATCDAHAGSSPHNVAFITSTSVMPTAIGGTLAGGDAECNARAAAAGLAGSYVALVSTSTVNARDRLAGSRGWVRVDGKPLLDLPDDMSAHKVYNPVALDESGADARSFLVLTGSDGSGDASSNTCMDYSTSSAAMQVEIGSPNSTGTDWLIAGNISCAMSARLYCFGVGKTAPLALSPAAGRLAFVTVQGFTPGGGVSAADALCASEASAAQLPGSYLALLTTTTASAISRFSLTGATWVRPDGIALAATPLGFASGQLDAPINVNATGAYDGGVSAWTGGPINQPATDPTATCTNWTSTTVTSTTGNVDSADGAFSSGGQNCSTPLPIYCLQQ